MNFRQLGLIPEIIKAIEKEGYTTPSPIQENAIPILLEGHDLLGSAQTGTGKTAAFAIPIIQKLAEKAKYSGRNPVSALILAPTRELAEQIKDSFITYTKFLNLKTGAVYGGVPQRRQEIMIEKGVDILVATPGRLLDLVKQKVVSLNNVETFVLDEADTMLDMGFIKDVKHINHLLINNKQTLMFSATISLEIRNLASVLLKSPRYLEMAPPTLMLDTISHSLIYADKEAKKEVLLDLLTNPSLSSVLVFTKTKHYANKLATFLKSYGIKVDAIHGDKSQNKRQQALNDFKSKKNRLLIATDIAARGIDIQELSHVINFDLPLSPETYVHRIGRTGRAGLTGSAITLCSPSEKVLLKAVIKHTNLKLVEMKLEPVSPDSKFKKLENFVEPETPKFQEDKRKRNNRDSFKSEGKRFKDRKESRTDDTSGEKDGKETRDLRSSKSDFPSRSRERKTNRSFKEERVTAARNEETPGETTNATDRPKRDYTSRPKRDYSDRPRRDYSDKPKSEEFDRPKRDYGSRPKRDYSDRPKRDYADKPKRDYGDRAKPTESDRPKRDYASRGTSSRTRDENGYKGERSDYRSKDTNSYGRKDEGQKPKAKTAKNPYIQEALKEDQKIARKQRFNTSKPKRDVRKGGKPWDQKPARTNGRRERVNKKTAA
ncbi:MAG: DEAD/DEAH box helicase [Bacilli bacterium]